MITTQETLLRLTDIQQIIKHRIAQRTCGRIRGLEVEVTDNVVVIRGCAASFHLKQLAIQGALDAVAKSSSGRIGMDVKIAVTAPLSDANFARGSR